MKLCFQRVQSAPLHHGVRVPAAQGGSQEETGAEGSHAGLRLDVCVLTARRGRRRISLFHRTTNDNNSTLIQQQQQQQQQREQNAQKAQNALHPFKNGFALLHPGQHWQRQSEDPSNGGLNRRILSTSHTPPHTYLPLTLKAPISFAGRGSEEGGPESLARCAF